MSNHITDTSKKVSDTPRTDAAYFKQGATMYDLAGEMKLVERELNAANAEIQILKYNIDRVMGMYAAKDNPNQEIAQAAYQIADAMLKARETK